MPSLLTEYQDLIETYVKGLSVETDRSFIFNINLEEQSFSFTRPTFISDESKLFRVKYTFDEETAKLENPSNESLKTLLHSIKEYLIDFLSPTSDENISFV